MNYPGGPSTQRYQESQRSLWSSNEFRLLMVTSVVGVCIAIIGAGIAIYNTGQQSESSARISQTEFTRGQRQVAYSTTVASIRDLTDQAQELLDSVSQTVGFGLPATDAEKEAFMAAASEMYAWSEGVVAEADLAIIGSAQARQSFNEVQVAVGDMLQRVAALHRVFEGKTMPLSGDEDPAQWSFREIGTKLDGVLCALDDFILVARVDQLGEEDPLPSTTTSIPTYDYCNAVDGS